MVIVVSRVVLKTLLLHRDIDSNAAAVVLPQRMLEARRVAPTASCCASKTHTWRRRACGRSL